MYVFRPYYIRSIQFIVMYGAMDVFYMRYGVLDIFLLEILQGVPYVVNIIILVIML